MPNLKRGATEAAKYGSMGSMFGPWGTAIGGGYGFLKGLFSGGNDEEKKKKKAEEDAAGDIAALRESSAGTRKQAGQLSAMGAESLAPVQNYFQKLLGEDPSALMEATKGERGRVIDQYDAARRAASQFGPRGGGTNAAISESYFQQANQLSDITSMAKRDAASQLGQLGATMTGLGLSADQLASADLNTVIQAVLGRENLALEKRGQTMELLGNIGSAAGSIAGAYMTR